MRNESYTIPETFMKRRSLLRSIVALPGVAGALPANPAQQDVTAARDKGLPAGPPLIPPGISETPNTPVTPADQTAECVTGTFSPEQLAALARLGELIAPSWSGKPGASEADGGRIFGFSGWLLASASHRPVQERSRHFESQLAGEI